MPTRTGEPIYKWAGLAFDLPDEHKIIRSAYTDRWAIFDQSGNRPEDTDDGVLWLDRDWNLIISSPDAVLCIPVIRALDDERFSTVTNMSTMLMLSHKFKWPIEDQLAGVTYNVNQVL